jgi:signal transduction histidine kinase/GAF domain-containing protein
MAPDQTAQIGDTTSVLLDIAQVAGSSLHLNEVLDRVVERAAALTGADRSSIWLLDPGGDVLAPAALYGMDSAFTAFWKRNTLALYDERLSHEALTTGRPVVVFDAEADERTNKAAVAMFGDKSILVVPLVSQGRALGTLFINHVRSRHDYSERDVEVTLGIASQAAVAIERAKLFAQSQRMSQEILDSFRRIGEALAAGHDLFATLKTVVTLASEIVHARVGLVELIGAGDVLTVQATYGTLANRLSECDEVKAVGRGVVKSGVSLRADDLALENIPGDHYWSGIGVPLQLRGVTLGALTIFHSAPNRFSDQDVSVLGSFANHASLAIENAGLFAALREQVAELSAAMAQNATLYGALEQEKERLLAIIRNSSDAIYMTDSEHRIVTFNPAAEQLTGWTADEIVGQSCTQFVNCRCPLSRSVVREADASPHGSHALRDCLIARVMSEGAPIPYIETSITTRQHEVKEIAASYSYVPAAADAGPFVLVIGRDISRLREVERLKSDFISVVSHELRTPLAVIKGYAATLLNPQVVVDRERELRFIKGINDASDRLTRLIDNVLSVSRFESGHFRLNLQPCDLRDTVAKVANSFQHASFKHEVTATPTESVLYARIDRDQIEQVLTNLISNAIKYSPEGGAIRISARAAGSGVEVAVADQGIGIPPEQLTTVFDKFFRGESRAQRHATGVGLGLYICRTAVEAHGGRIWAESEVGSGSTFRFWLPRTPTGASADTPAA